MIEFGKTFLAVLAQLSPWLLFGFLIAGILHALVPQALMARVMGGKGLGPIVRATLVVSRYRCARAASSRWRRS